MSNFWASAVLGILAIMCLGMCVDGLLERKMASADPRKWARRSLARWAVLAVAGLAMWMIARAQASN